MRKYLLALCFIVLIAFIGDVEAADSKVTALPEVTDVEGADVMYVVDDVAGTPTSKKITVTSLFGTAGDVDATVNNLTASTINTGDASALVNGVSQLQMTVDAPQAGEIYPITIATDTYAPNDLSLNGNFEVMRESTEAGTFEFALIYSDFDGSNDVTLSTVTLTAAEYQDSAAPTTQDLPNDKRIYFTVSTDATEKYTVVQPFLKKKA